MQDLVPSAGGPDAAGSRSVNIRASKVQGAEVFNEAGERLGQIDDIVLSRKEGRAVYAIMSFGGFLGIGERFHALPWESLLFDELIGGYVVPLTRAQLEEAPTYRPGEDPDWNDPALAGVLTPHGPAPA